jgi:hypothetical protein
MPFQKGNIGKPNGAISRKTREWDRLGDFLTQSGANRVKQILDDCDDETFLKYFGMFLEYFKPKLARVESEVKQETTLTGQLQINVINQDDIDKINNL